MTPALIKDLGCKPYGFKGKKTRFGLYECPICKKQWEVRTADVKNGSTTKCQSCKISINNTTHGMAHMDEHKLLKGMIRRCYDDRYHAYKDYGGRGIRVCDEWLNDPSEFIKWCWASGYDKGLKIDRINNDGNYEPSNCRFITHQENCCNTRLISRKNTSGYRGVSFYGGKWHAEITVNKKRHRLGRFTCAEDAAMAYDKFVVDNNLLHPTNVITQKDVNVCE